MTSACGFAIIANVPSEQDMREWRNRQTRTFEGRVVIPYGFKSRLSHQEDSARSPLFLAISYAGMAESADALDSGSSRGNSVQVQVLLPAPNSSNPNLIPIGEGFGFVVFLNDY